MGNNTAAFLIASDALAADFEQALKNHQTNGADYLAAIARWKECIRKDAPLSETQRAFHSVRYCSNLMKTNRQKLADLQHSLTTQLDALFEASHG
jgi:hypothetical protein